MPNVEFALPMPAQSSVSLTTAIWLKPKSASLTSDGLITRFQLSARFLNGASWLLPSSRGNARLSIRSVNSAYEKRPKTLSLFDGLQSTRTSA